MATTKPETPQARLPRDLRDSTSFLLKRLGYAAKERATVAFEATGLTPYHYAVLLALYTQKLMGYDAWTSGLVLAPGGIGNMTALLISGRLVRRVDQRMLLAFGCALNAVAFFINSRQKRFARNTLQQLFAGVACRAGLRGPKACSWSTRTRSCWGGSDSTRSPRLKPSTPKLPSNR